MRTATATATAVSAVLGTGAALAVAAGRYASDAALKAGSDGQPPWEPRLTVHSAGDGKVVLTRSLAALRPGVHGLAGLGVHAAVGPILEAERPTSADTVVRRLDTVTRGRLEPGTKVRFTPQVFAGNPLSALGLKYEEVEIGGELGPLPGWYLPGARDTWVIAVHGLGTTREHPMVLMDFLHRQRFPVLSLDYRGDEGAPGLPGGLSHFGETEWHDVDAAIRYAVRHGARRVVLHGWSTGAAMALHAATGAGLRERISGIVLDSPVLDWEATVRALASAQRTPSALLPLVVRTARARTGISGERLRRAAHPASLAVPTLILHGPDDHIAPWRPARDLADARPDLVTLHTVRGASHGAMWNADPTGYEEALRRFLTPLM